MKCIVKLNDQNKRLLSLVENIAKNAEASQSVCPVETVPSELSQEISTKSKILDGVSERLEKIEQNLNANTLICRGPTVSDLISSATSGTTTNLISLKGDICKSVCGEDMLNVDIGNIQVGLFGKEKKSLKIECSNLSTKIQLLKQARIRRPTGLFLSEFLTPTKHSVFYNLRQLRKQHPEKFKSVFTRGGNIFYRLSDSDRLYQVSSLDDIGKINLQQQVAENTG